MATKQPKSQQHQFVEYGGQTSATSKSSQRHTLPQSQNQSPSLPAQQQQQQSLPLASATALDAIESGLRVSIIDLCLDQRTTLLTYFVASEEQEYFRDCLKTQEHRDRCDLKLEELENIERTQRFEILFEAEIDWETLTGRLGAESFSMVARKVVEDLERRQYLSLVMQLTRDREHVHRCDIMAEGLLPGFIREQEAFSKKAWDDLSDILIDECVSREALIRNEFIEDAPMLSSFSMQRDEITCEQAILRTHLIQRPFFAYVEITKQIRDEFAAFWMSRLLQFHEHISVAEEDLYQQVLIEEESVCREFDLIPKVVGGLEEIWRDQNIEHPETVERNALEVEEVLKKEAVWRVAFCERQQQECRERLELFSQFSDHIWRSLYPEWKQERNEMLESFANLIRCALISQRTTLEFIAIGSRRGIISQWSDSVFKTAQSALLDREDLLRFEQEEPYFELEELFCVEAEELHTRHTRILMFQIDQVFRIYQKAIVHEEVTARNYIVDVEWENGIIFMYASFHRLWLETVTMGVTRNALKREWERETLVMCEVWVRLRIASRASFALDSEVMGQVRYFMPDFDELATPLEENEDGDGEEEDKEREYDEGNSDKPRIGDKEKSIHQSPRSKKTKIDVNALPAVFYIGEDPFGNDSPSSENNNNNNNRNSNRSSTHILNAPAPPSFMNNNNNNQITPGIVVRFRQTPRSTMMMMTSDSDDLPNLDRDYNNDNNNTNYTQRPAGRNARKKNLDSVFASPTLNAAAGSVWISPDTFDVVSIRATLKVLGKARNHAFALLTQFFQITHRKHLESKYDEWLEGYGDMGYWAHAIEVGLLDQLHSLDADFVEQTERTQNLALRRASPQFKNQADEELSGFVHERDFHLSQQRATRKRTVIDALRESLRQPKRPSQRKFRSVPLVIDPELMCPRPKSSFEDWSPSRMTPDEFAHYEHNLILRSAGVEKKSTNASNNNDESPTAITTNHNRGKNLSATSTTALPTSKNGDPAWSIYQRSSQHHFVPHYARQEQQKQQQLQLQQSSRRNYHLHHRQHEQIEEEGHDDIDDDNSHEVTGRHSPGNRADSLVRFKDDQQQQQESYSVKKPNRPVSAQTIPRLVPSRLGDRGDEDEQERLMMIMTNTRTNPGVDSYSSSRSVPHARRHHEQTVGNIPLSQQRKSKSERRGGAAVDPNVEHRRLQFTDIYADNYYDNHHEMTFSPTTAAEHRHRQQRADAAAPVRSLKSQSTGKSNTTTTSLISDHEANTLRAYKKVLSRTESSQRSMTESTCDFLQQSMRPISLIVRPTPPPTPIPGNVASPRKPSRRL